MTTQAKAQHTPGPWHINRDGNDVENVNDAGVCAMYADETSEANARLIAAAPEMLEALRIAVNNVPWSMLPADTNPILDQIVAAIAKAERRDQ